MQTTGTQKFNFLLTIDWDNQTFSIKNGHLFFNKKEVTYKFSQLEFCYIIQSGDTKKTKHVITRTLIGSMVAGSIGALAGILSAGNEYTVCTGLTLHLSIKNDNDYDLQLITGSSKTSSFTYRQSLKNARDMVEVFQQIMSTELK